VEFRLQTLNQPLFTRYEAGSVTWGDHELSHSFLILGEGTLIQDLKTELEEESSSVFSCLSFYWGRLLASQPEVVLVGTGSQLRFPSMADRALWTQAKEKGLPSIAEVPIEWMDTLAAYRTYNILLSEQRKVAGLFWMDDQKGLDS
jgi:uncharacterized protein